MTDSDEDAYIAALCALHEGLHRLGPGSEAATREALGRIRDRLPANPRILDLGCGAGASALTLAESLGETLAAPIIAVDMYGPYIDTLNETAAERGLTGFVDARVGDFGALDLLEGMADLIWSEGAIYLLGFQAGLELWRPLLRPGGVIVASELSWFTDEPAAGARAYFETGYPGMATIAGNRARAEAAGYRTIDTFNLPSSAWWEGYYDPLKARIDGLDPEATTAPIMAAVIADIAEEMRLFAAHSDEYGYAFYLLQKV
ncbi:MAG: class I SAM-dependent methyltransferase [Hyphomicrobiales bacterium]|nr:class I SAM-dependent methyltransferase [Hyphomicrobiales bacterium]